MKKDRIDIDLLIIGSGFSGLTSAIYASRAKIPTIVLAKKAQSGEKNEDYTIENYPGFSKISGQELNSGMRSQAEKLGASFYEFEKITSVKLADEIKEIETEDTIFTPKSVIIAVGAEPFTMNISNEERFKGKGVHYCAISDGAMYKDKNVIVVGGEDASLEEAYFLSKLAKDVTIIQDDGKFNAKKTTLDKVLTKDNIRIMYNWDLVKVDGKDFVDTAVIKSTTSQSERRLQVSAVFKNNGKCSSTELFKDFVKVDERGYIPTNEQMGTNIRGVYAVGDVRSKEYKQITNAVSDGTVAAFEVEKFLLS